MDPLYVHLVLNHFPVIGTLIGIALLGLGFASRSDAVKRASLVILLGMAIMTIPVYLTGEPAEERVENAGGVSQPVIEEHEEAAKFAFAAMGFAGIIALGADHVVSRREIRQLRIRRGPRRLTRCVWPHCSHREPWRPDTSRGDTSRHDGDDRDRIKTENP